jgi:hypothetical protein
MSAGDPPHDRFCDACYTMDFCGIGSQFITMYTKDTERT